MQCCPKRSNYIFREILEKKYDCDPLFPPHPPSRLSCTSFSELVTCFPQAPACFSHPPTYFTSSICKLFPSIHLPPFPAPFHSPSLSLYKILYFFTVYLHSSPTHHLSIFSLLQHFILSISIFLHHLSSSHLPLPLQHHHNPQLQRDNKPVDKPLSVRLNPPDYL